MRNLTLAILLIFLDFRYSLIGFRLKRAGTSCMTPSGESGNCIKITDCKPAFDLLVNNKNDSKIREQIKSLKCGYEENQPKVCCKLESLRDDGPTELPDSSSNKFPEDCGRSDVPTFNRLFGARPARLGAWPWMVFLGYYKNNDNKTLRLLCAGSLISDRLVVTARHCLDTKLKIKITVARLGELDYNTTIDGAITIDVPIEALITHNFTQEEYLMNDIGLIRLKQPVSFTSHIRPICLPTSEIWKTKSYVGAHPHQIGWGAQKSLGPLSTHLLEVQIEIKDNEDCRQAFKSLSIKHEFDNSVICTGGGKIDTCQGDSGAPLMIKEDGRFYLYGFATFGASRCGNFTPSVNTNVVHFIDWIKRKAFDET